MNRTKWKNPGNIIIIFIVATLTTLSIAVLAGDVHPWCDVWTYVCPPLDTRCQNTPGYRGIWPFGFHYESYKDMPAPPGVTLRCIGNTEPDPECEWLPKLPCRIRYYYMEPNCEVEINFYNEDFRNTDCKDKY